VAQQTAQKELELNKLREEKRQCIQRAIQLSKDHDIVWTQEIRTLADIMERELLLLDQQWLIKNISEEITRVYRDNNISIWEHVDRYLSPRFKNEKLSTSTSAPPGPQVLEQLSTLMTNLFQIPREQIAEIHNTTRQLQLQCKKRAEVEHIALIPDDNSSNADQINDGKEDNRDHVTIDKPRPHGSLTYDAMTESIEMMTGVRGRISEFPPEILAKDGLIADGIRVWNTWMGPALDLKYSKNWLDWFRTEKYRDIYGKHAAAVMSFSVTNLCANCSDEKTKEWVRMEPVTANAFSTYKCLQCGYKLDTVCPACNLPLKESEKQVVGWQCSNCEGTVPLERDLTREQVGDKSSIIVDAAMEVLNHIPNFMAFCAWYSDWVDPYVAGRKIRLSGDLSDKA
jgi:transcription elongation factor Elf1